MVGCGRKSAPYLPHASLAQ
ncbi:MAG: hypothetical protein ACI3XV_05430 [Bacteroidaceae bacterium]